MAESECQEDRRGLLIPFVLKFEGNPGLDGSTRRRKVSATPAPSNKRPRLSSEQKRKRPIDRQPATPRRKEKVAIVSPSTAGSRDAKVPSADHEGLLRLLVSELASVKRELATRAAPLTGPCASPVDTTPIVNAPILDSTPTVPTVPQLPSPALSMDASTGIVPLSAVLSMIAANERQSVQAVFESQALQNAQAMADTQRMLAIYLSRK